MGNYVLDPQKKKLFMMAFILDQMVDKNVIFPVVLSDNDVLLQNLFIEMMSMDLLTVQNNEYAVTDRGATFIDNFYQKYKEFLKLYDIFCAVDLEAGEFAFSSYYDFDDDTQWKLFLEDQRWDDVRVAVCEFKKIDPVEIVFLSFMAENRFTQNANWQFDLISDLIWNEMIQVCNTAIPLEDLLIDDAIQDIIKQGSTIMMDLLKEEHRRVLEEAKERLTQNEITQEEYVEEVTYVEEEVIYYEPYYGNIYYVSPCWVWVL